MFQVWHVTGSEIVGFQERQSDFLKALFATGQLAMTFTSNDSFVPLLSGIVVPFVALPL